MGGGGTRPGRCLLLHLGICRANEPLGTGWRQGEERGGAATEGRRGNARACLLHIGWWVGLDARECQKDPDELGSQSIWRRGFVCVCLVMGGGDVRVGRAGSDGGLRLLLRREPSVAPSARGPQRAPIHPNADPCRAVHQTSAGQGPPGFWHHPSCTGQIDMQCLAAVLRCPREYSGQLAPNPPRRPPPPPLTHPPTHSSILPSSLLPARQPASALACRAPPFACDRAREPPQPRWLMPDQSVSGIALGLFCICSVWEVGR